MVERSEIESDRFLAHLTSQSLAAGNESSFHRGFQQPQNMAFSVNEDVDRTRTSSDQSKDSSDAVEAEPKDWSAIENEIADPKLRGALNRALKSQNKADEKGVNEKTRNRLLLQAVGNYSTALRLTAQQNEGDNSAVLEAAIHNNIGAAYAAIGRLDDAIDSFAKSIELYPNGATAHYNYGVVCIQNGKADADAYHSLGVACMLHGDSDGGANYLKRAINLGSKNSDTYLYMAVYCRITDELHEANDHLEKAAELSPSININSKYVCTFLQIGYNYLQNSNFVEAAKHLKKATEIDPDDEITYMNLGYAFEKINRLEDAIECCLEALAINPENIIAHHNLGIAYARAGNFEAALESSLQAIRIKPDFAIAYIGRGLIYLKKGERNEMEEDFVVALSLDPGLYWEEYADIFADIPRKMEEEEAPWNDLRAALIQAQERLAQLDAEPEQREGWATLLNGALEAVDKLAPLRKDIRRLNRAAKHLAIEECRDVRLELGYALNEALDRLDDLAAFQREMSRHALSMEASGEEKSGFAAALLRLNRSLEDVKIGDANEVLDEIQGENAIQSLRYLETRIKTGGRTFTRDEMNER